MTECIEILAGYTFRRLAEGRECGFLGILRAGEKGVETSPSGIVQTRAHGREP